MNVFRLLGAAAIIATGLTSPLMSQTAPVASPPAALSGATSPPAIMELSLGQRTAITRELVAKWAPTVKASSGGSVSRWTARLTSEISTADPNNVLRATAMPTFDLMHAALNGYVPTAAEMVQSTGVAGTRSAIGNATVEPQVIGSTTADLTYTPLSAGRCRIADSRVIANPLYTGGTRHLDVTAIASYASQGGSGPVAGANSSAGCGLPAFPAAYAISVTLLNPVGDGTFKLYPYSKPHQTAATSIFNAGTFGASENLIVSACLNCAYDVSIRTSATVHYVIDVIGYFMPPQATPLQCMYTAAVTHYPAHNQAFNVQSPACAAGYTSVSTACQAGANNMPFRSIVDGLCAGINLSGGASYVQSNRFCCRVPGR